MEKRFIIFFLIIHLLLQFKEREKGRIIEEEFPIELEEDNNDKKNNKKRKFEKQKQYFSFIMIIYNFFLEIKILKELQKMQNMVSVVKKKDLKKTQLKVQQMFVILIH